MSCQYTFKGYALDKYVIIQNLNSCLCCFHPYLYSLRCLYGDFLSRTDFVTQTQGHALKAKHLYKNRHKKNIKCLLPDSSLVFVCAQ